jgi:hypothetical protein
VERRWGVREFQWDDGNEEHIARHGVTPAEAEEVFFGRFSVKRSRLDRYVVMGRSGAGRYLVVVIEKLGAGWVRVVTARDMSTAERKLYSKRRK